MRQLKPKGGASPSSIQIVIHLIFTLSAYLPLHLSREKGDLGTS
jgi:hypothetical protein